MMRILLTGGTGYIGSRVLTTLQRHGHEVVAAVRSEQAAATVADARATTAIGDLADRGWLQDLLGDSDGAIHLAHPGPEADDAVIASVESV